MAKRLLSFSFGNQNYSRIFFNKYTDTKINNPPVRCSLTTIYRFRFIEVCSVFNKCKKIQLGVSAVSIPISFVSYLTNSCEAEIPILVSIIGVASTVALFSVGQVFNRFIGYVYASEDEKEIKLAYLDFWGNRKDIICAIKDIKPLSCESSLKDTLYKTVHVSKCSKPFKLNLSRGEIYNNYIFDKVFRNERETENK